MKILIAFDSFKGCLTAEEVCLAAQKGVYEAGFEGEVVCVPLSDGGEGLVDCFLRTGKAHPVCVKVHGPLMEEVDVTYAVSEDGKTAYMEMASACGLTLVPVEQRNPMETTTYGLGEMLVDVIERGVCHVVLGIGGSATCDGGMGMLKALASWQEAKGGWQEAGKSLRLTVACDVDNPLYGSDGAAYVFAPQKGATPEQVELLDRRLRAFALATEELGLAERGDAFSAGAGAAGGLGYALQAYLNAELRSGVEIVLDECGFDDVLRGADVVLTGEGCSDGQTLHGKVAAGVLRRARKWGVKTVLMSGQIKDREALAAAGFDCLVCVNKDDGRPLDELMQSDVAMENIKGACQRMMEDFQ